jgi:glycosyltransferase involved in cell wall biosynthesis
VTVSCCIVTYNEAHRIGHTLDCVADIVDEIVVVDQSSTDLTFTTVFHWGKGTPTNPPTKVLSDKHHGYCEPSRQKAHDASTGDWILVLDADEKVSKEFRDEMQGIMNNGDHLGARLKRGLWIGGEFRWAGDYQYRFFRRDAVRYLDEIHTEPQPTIHKNLIYSPEYIGIYHTKTWVEQVRDELAYEARIGEKDPRREAKLALNVHLKLLREKGITAEEADAMTIEERIQAGIGAG